MPRPERRARLHAAARATAYFFTGGDRVIAALLAVVVLYYVTTRGIFQGKASGDGFFGFMYLPSLLFHHTLDIAREVPFWAPIFGKEKTGYTANPCPIGPVLFWLVPYLVGLAVDGIAAVVAHVRPALPGQSVFDFWMAGLGSLVAGLAGIGCMYRLLARKLGVASARVGTVAATLATPIVWYLVTQPLYQHACAFFVVTLFVERWDAWRGDETGLSPRRMALLGAIGGFAMLTRIQEAIFLLLPGIDALAALVRALRVRRFPEARRAFVGGVLLAAMAALVFAPQVWIWWRYFAELRTPQPHGHMRWRDPAIVAAIFSMRGGLLPWSPVLYLVAPGLWAARTKLGALGAALAALFVVELWVNASAWDHWASFCFGARRFTDATLTFATGIAGAWWWVRERARRARETGASRRGAGALLVVFLTFCVAYNTLLMEMMRSLRIKSSGSGTFPASQWVKWARGPAWLGRALDVTGYPFAQPAGWIFAALHHVGPTAFEGSVGMYILERDCRIHGVTNMPAITFAEPGQLVPDGIAGRPDPNDKSKPPLVPVATRVRLLVPLFAREPLRVYVDGEFPLAAAVTATWNGVPLERAPKSAGKKRIELQLPSVLVRTRSEVNELVLDVPPGTKLQKVEFASFEPWWR